MSSVKRDFVILAAGQGKRLWPITAEIPKVMAPILNKPLLERTIECIYPFASSIVVVVGFKKEAVTAHFSNSKYSDKVVFAEQTERMGSGHAILFAEPFISGDFAVINGDLLAEKRFFESIARAKIHSIVGKFVSDASRFGVLKHDSEMNLLDIVEKPNDGKPGLINSGAFFVPSSFFDLIKSLEKSPRGEYEQTDALVALSKTRPVKVLPYDGYWDDMGTYWSYLDGTKKMVELCEGRVEGKVEGGVQVRGKLFLPKTSSIKAGSRIEGDAVIGENTSIGPGAFLRGFAVVGSNCVVGKSEVRNSVLFDGCSISDSAEASNSVLCSGAKMERGAKTIDRRPDGKSVSCVLDGKAVDSGRRELGAVLGSEAVAEENSSIGCGVLVAPHSRIPANKFVEKNIF